MRDRVEILKSGRWVELVLKQEKIKYNALSNKISSIEARKINHSNTFSLPYVSENIIALEINIFSPVLMAQALNKKYPARYFIKDKLAQRGYLVINNTVRGDINVNFIDEALVITDEWGKITFKQLLKGLGDNITQFPKQILCPSFINVINILKNYETDKTKQVLNAPISKFLGDDASIDTKDFYIARYPNLLNNIGEKFNIDKDEVRKPDSFNPFQSRPIFSILGFVYVICQAFGYYLRLDPGVDFNLLRDTYLVNKGEDGGTPPKDSTLPSQTGTIASTEPQYSDYDKHGVGEGDNEGFYEHFFLYPNDVPTVDQFGKKIGVASKRPEEILGYVPSHFRPYVRLNLMSQNCIVLIEDNPYLGEVIWTGKISRRAPDNRFDYRRFAVKSIWLNASGYGIEADFNVTTEDRNDGDRSFTITGDKEQLNNTPPGAVTFVGLICRVEILHKGSYWNDIPTMTDMHFVEKVLPKGKTSFDTYGQFLQNHTNLLDLAPDVSVKELLSSILQQQGLLISFERNTNGVQNIVKLFTYGAYRDRVQEARDGQLNKYYDWSQYHQRLVPALFNTDYGSEYGEINEISLSAPFPGNVGRIQISTDITSKGFQTKLIPLAKNQAKNLNDVSAVSAILNTDPYFEYTLKEKGLIKCSFDQYLPGTRMQYNAELAVSAIAASPLPLLSNVIYSDGFLPIGIKEWYLLVDESVKSQATFLLPILVLRTFDISLPVYIESLGGFYIVEEIEEYTDNVTLVKVNLIKLPLPSNLLTPPVVIEADYSEPDYSDPDYSN